ncbi:MAG: DUF349 domain-containing protein [Chitinophagia bacterium]|nr:DUF349 domain-containing protein [Chitinophagia bacterium]
MAAAELHTDLQQWWAAQEFEGKEIYSLSEDGTLSLIDAPPLKARKITTLTLEDADLTLATLRDKFTPLHEEMVALMVEWKTVPDKLTLDRKITQQMENIASTYAIGNLLEIAQTLEEWHKEITTAIDANYEAKLEIVAKAVALIDNTNWKETTQAFKDLSDQYKVAGYLDRERNEALLNRLEDARASFYEKKKAHFESEDTDLMLNLDLKIELAEKAERLAQAESWKQGTEFFLSVVEEWKKIGRTLPKKNEELWQRIMTAKNNFFDRKKEFLNAQKIEQEANLRA